MNTFAVEARGIERSFGNTKVLHGVSLEVAQGEFVSLVGSSGCGKTTLLRIIGGFDQPDAGSVYISGRDVTETPPESRSSNMVFQRGALFPHMSVAENIGYGLRRAKVSASSIKTRVDEMLELIRLREFGRRRPSELSGGQAQRVALARALINRPKVLLLDEPFSALDLSLRKELQLELKRIHRELGCAFIFVTHDQEEALVLSDRVAMMNKGRIVQIGKPTEIYQEPVDVFSAQFIGEMNLLPGHVTYVSGDVATVDVGDDHSVLVSTLGRTFSNGQRVFVTARPEDVALGIEGSGPLTGVVDEEIYIGSRRRFRVICKELSIPILAETNAIAGANYTRGSVVGISLNIESSRLLSAE